MGDSDDDVHLGTRRCACVYKRVLLLQSLQTVVRLFDRAGKKVLTCMEAGLMTERKSTLRQLVTG